MCYPGHGDCVTCLMEAVVVRVSQPYVLGQASLSKMSNSQLINGILLNNYKIRTEVRVLGRVGAVHMCVDNHLCRLLSPIVNTTSL